MIWALLFAFIFSGSESVFLNSKVQKHIKKHVESKEAKSNILQILKDYEKEVNKFQKEKKKMARELAVLNADRNASETNFRAFFSRFMDQQEKIDEQGLQGRLKIQPLITDAEWEKLMVDAEVVYEKDKKTREKSISKLHKSISKAKQKAEKIITEESGKLQIQKVLSDFKSTVIEIQKKINTYNYIENSTMADQKSTKEELQQIQEEVNQLKWQFFDAYIHTHMQLVDYSTAEEWDAVIKAMNKIF